MPKPIPFKKYLDKYIGDKLKEIWEAVKIFFIAQSVTIWSGLHDLLPSMIDKFFERFMNWAGSVETRNWDAFLDGYIAMGMITQAQKKRLMSLKDIAHPLDWFVFIPLAVFMMKTYITSLVRPGQNFVEQASNKKYRPNMPYHSEVLPAAFIAPEKTGEVRDLLARAGFNEKDIDLLFLSYYRLYDETTISVLWLRKVLSDDEMFMRMRELGYTDTRIKEIIQSWSLLPSPSDLFFMVGHEAFEPDIYGPMGLDQEFPTEQTEWLKKQGISEEWAKKYWIAHWEQPSIQQGYDMLHRGVIGFEELNILFKTVEIPPYWRDKLTAIAYMPYTRVDVRRMHDMGVLSDEETYRAYKDLGYDDDKAAGMLRFTIDYNRQNDKELTMAQIKKSYKERAIDKTEALGLLKNIGYSADHADYLLTFEDYMAARELQDDMIDNIRDRYQNNLITLSQAETGLNGLDLPGAQIAVLLDKWKIKVYKSRKLPGRADLGKFLLLDIIDQDRYRIEMENLGYNFKHTEWYEKIIMIEKGSK